jgi:hypothetical protein
VSSLYGRGQCPECGGEFNLTKAGTMRHHNGDIFVNGWRQVCEGVGKTPKTVVASDVGSELESLRQENADLRAKLGSAVRIVSTAYPTTPDELTAVVRQIGEITHVPAVETFIWTGYDDEERGFPVFTTRKAAQDYAEHRFRTDYATEFGLDACGNIDVRFVERNAYTDAHSGRAGLFDLTTGNGSTGYVVHEVTLHDTTDSAIREDQKREAVSDE